MTDPPSSSSLYPSGEKKSATSESSHKKQETKNEQETPSQPGSRKKSRFPASKRVEFTGALGLVVWVWAEMLETHDGRKLIVQCLILVIFYISVCYYVSKWSRSKWFGYSLYFVATILTALFAYFNSISPAFSIVPRLQYIAVKNTRYFLYWNFNQRKILSPIQVRMLVQFTNLRDKDMMVTSYQFEGHLTNGTWQVMPSIDLSIGQVVGFVGTNYEGGSMQEVLLGPVKEGDVFVERFGEDIFPAALEARNIHPGATINGEVLLEAPTNGFDGTMRCRVLDATDREFVALVKPVTTNKILNAWIPNYAGVSTTREQEDISALPQVRYSDLWHPSP